jgi:hypothetical protein
MSDPHNWSEFRQRQPGAAPAATDPDFDEICVRALTGAAGQQLLEALRRQYIERPENPGAPEAVLRVRVTQQQFVRDLEAARDRGAEAIKRKAEAARKTP